MKDKIILVIGLIIIVAGLIYAVNLHKNNTSEEAIVKSLVDNWKIFEPTIPDRPVLGSTAWNYPSIIQIIASDKLLIEYDDGHIIKYSVLGYKKGSEFSFLENVGKTNELSPDDWNLVQLKYGNGYEMPSTFKFTALASGINVDSSQWVKIDENPFTQSSAPAKTSSASPNVSSNQGQSTAISNVSKVKIAFLIDSQDLSYRGAGVVVGCDKAVLVERQIVPTTMPLNAAMKLLFNDKTPWPYKEGVPGNFIGGRPDFPLTFSKATLQDGVAKIYIYGNVGLAGVCDDPRLTSQVEQTAFQFLSVKSVKIYVNDKEWTTPNEKGE